MVVLNAREGHGRALLEVLDHLRQGANGTSDMTVQVLAAADHDGVCSALVLARVLREARVKFCIDPVSGNDAILEHFHGLEANPEVRSIVLLNCGGSLDLQRELELCKAPAGVKCFVIDSHRPLLLPNLSQRHDRVIVLDHDAEEMAVSRPPRPDPDADLGEESGSEGDRAGDEEEWDPDSELLNPAERAARRAERTLQQHERRRRRAERRQAREAERQQQLNDYYKETYYAMPAAISLCRMAAQQSAGTSQDLLWLGSVSVAAYHDLGLISDIEYDMIARDYLKEAYDLADGASAAASQSSSQQLGSQGGASQDAAMGSDGEELTPEKPRMPTARANGRRRSLRFESDLRLTLYKHWTLEESVMHSPHFHRAFKLHQDKGVRMLKCFFAKAGIDPVQYKQFYGAMKIPIRKSIQKKFRQHGKEVGLSESAMFLDQFVRNHGVLEEENKTLFMNELSCLDAVHVVLAHLSAVPAALSGASLEKLPTTADGHRDLKEIQEKEREAMFENFERATQAVLNKEPGHLKEGVCLAVEVARGVQSMARMIMDTKATRKCHRFRWCKVEQPGHIFRHHLSVRRLAVWLLRVFFSEQSGTRGDRHMPLLLITRDRVRETYLCVGVTPKQGPLDGDLFGSIFRGALKADPSLKYAYDYFEKSCIEVAVDDFDRFMDLITAAS